MKTKTAPLPAEPLPAEPLPAGIESLKTLDAELSKLRTESERLTGVAEQSSSQLAAQLAQSDLADAAQLQALAALDLQARLAPQRLATLAVTIAEKETALRGAIGDALTVVRKTALKVGCGHAELAARAFLPFCEDIKEARDKGRDSKAALEWFSFERNIGGAGVPEGRDPLPMARRLVSDYEKAAPELADVTARLAAIGATIPTHREIVQPYF